MAHAGTIPQGLSPKISLWAAHRGELAATLVGALRGAAHQDARGDAGEEPADRADDAGDEPSADDADEADHREDGAATRGVWMCARDTPCRGYVCIKCEPKLDVCGFLHSMLHLWPCAQPCECSVLVGTIYCVC